MKRPKITSLRDRNFLLLGMAFLLLGAVVLGLSYVLHFPAIIAVRGGLGIGTLICLTHFGARLFSRR